MGKSAKIFIHKMIQNPWSLKERKYTTSVDRRKEVKIPGCPH
jgi:hypothetical protein